MTATAVTDATRLQDTEYEARIERLRGYREQLDRADHDADSNSLARAADLAAVYVDKRWVDKLPAPKISSYRGRPVQPDSLSRFAKWVYTDPEADIRFRPARCYQLIRANEVADYFHAVEINPGTSEYALRPLTRLLKDDRGDQAPAVWQRARQLAEGALPTFEQVKTALADHNKATGYAKPRQRTDDGQSFNNVSKRLLRDFEWVSRNGTEEQVKTVLAQLQERLAVLKQARAK